MAATSLTLLWTSIADAGRDLVRGRLSGRRPDAIALCRELLSTRGEASGAAIAREILGILSTATAARRLEFMQGLASSFTVDRSRISAAAADYARSPGLQELLTLRRATEAPRLDLFQRMNIAPDGTRALVKLRAELLGHLRAHPELAEVDADLQALMTSWFNPGFLSLARIDWQSPAALLEKFIAYEKVHRMRALEDMKRRLAADRRCFAFFHPALPDEPLIFVQVALVQGIADSIPAAHRSRDPGGRPRRRRHRHLLFHQQLPGGPARHHAGRLPDQGRRRRPRRRAARHPHLRHALAAAGLRPLAHRGAGLGRSGDPARRPARPRPSGGRDLAG